MSEPRVYRAGQPIEDYCRACKLDRHHTVLVVDGAGDPIRVQCDYCGSQHNYRGVRSQESGFRGSQESSFRRSQASCASGIEAPGVSAIQPSGVSAEYPVERTMESETDLESTLRRIIREEAGLTPVAPAAKWRGGTLVLRPANASLQEKTWPIDTFFHKIVMLRNRLRTLEQQVNASELPEDAKLKLQAYISGCYGSLTSFNLLFADDADGFKGSGGGD